MGKVIKIFFAFVLVISVALSGIFITTLASPGFREDVEIFLNIDDENSISSLKNQIAEKDEQINGFEARIEDLKANISDLEETTEILEVEDKELKAEIERLKARVQELEKQAENLDGTIDDLNSQLEEMNKAVDELWNIYTNLNKYENALNNGTSTETELTESEKALLEEKIENLEETISELTNEIEDLNETISDLTNQIEDLENQKIKIQNDKIVNENIIVDRTKTIEELNVTINNYYKDIENIDNSIENNTITINKLTSKIDNGESLTDEEQKQLTDLQTANENLKTQKYDINKNLTECENRVTVIQSEVEILVKNNENYSKQIASLDEQITTLENEILALENETINIQSNINSLQSKIDKFNGLISNSTIKNENGDVVQEPSTPVNPEQPEQPVDPETPGEVVPTTLKFVIYGEEYTYEAGMTWKEFINSEYNTYGTFYYLDDGSVRGFSADGEQLILCAWNDGNYVLYSDVISSDINYILTKIHTCFVNNYNIENEVYLDDGSRQYDYVGYCTCGTEISRETIVEKAEAKTVFTIDGVEYTYEAGMTWKEFINSEYNIYGTFYYLDDGSVRGFSADGEQLILCVWSDGNYVSYGDVISSDINYILTNIHTCFVNNYNIENEVYLDDGSRQYDYVGYCYCGTEISRETIVEKAEAKTVFIIDGEEYTYEDGMNWKDFVKSEYNSMGLYVSDSNNLVYLNERILTSDGVAVDGYYLIQSTTYTFSS